MSLVAGSTQRLNATARKSQSNQRSSALVYLNAATISSVEIAYRV